MSIKQILPDTYSKSVKSKIEKVQTNERYKNFTQTHFTAGDEEQFYSNIICKQPSILIKEELLDHNDIWSNYKISPDAIKNTFSYIFYKFKKGCFIQIRNNKLVRFLPFSNNFFVNEWSHLIKVPENLLKDSSILPVRFWYSNNGLFRYESPCNETDTGMCHMKNMFEELCKTHKDIPDIDLFINRRDFPLLKRDFTEPYDNIYNSENEPLVSHRYEEYLPILSMCTNDTFADIPIPTMDDWSRVMYKENVHFLSTQRIIATEDNFITPWENKHSVFLFRGSNTGIGYNHTNNTRLLLYKMFGDHPHCDIGITSWNDRYRKVKGDSLIYKPIKNIPLVKSISLEEQSKYKYIIHIQGHTQAFRLGIELAMNSVILLVKGKYKIWYESKLEPWVHYVPVSEDLSDLEERIQWCLENDLECKNIAMRAREFYETNLNKTGCLSYLKNILCEISQKCLKTFFKNYSPFVDTQYIKNSYIQSYPYYRNEHNTIETKDRTYFNLKTLSNLKFSRRKRTIFKNNNTEINIVNEEYVTKNSKFKSKICHEKFVGLYCINRLLQKIPNFVYTIPIQSPELTLEYIKGQSLFDYIKSKRFSLNECIFMIIQILLSISVGQQTCFFTHNDLCSWNVILTFYDKEQIYDYLLDSDNIYRVFSTVIPVIIDFDKSHVIYEMQSFTNYYDYNSYNDTLCLLINCIYNILKYQKLSTEEEKNILNIFRGTLCDPIYCPIETINNIRDLKNFLEIAHKYSHITFSHKGSLNFRKPIDAIKILKSFYKPCYIGSTKVINNFTQVSEICYRNIGNIPKSISAPIGVHPFFDLYFKQLYCTEEIKYKINRETYKLDNINIPLLTENYICSIYDIPSQYLDFINIFIELINNGGQYSLFPEEKNNLKKLTQSYLKTHDIIYHYAKNLIKFKIQRII